MNKKYILTAVAGTVTLAGVVAVFLTRPGMLAGDEGGKIPFALSLILALVGLTVTVLSLLPERKPTQVRTLAMAALFAALCYVGFAYCRIDIFVGTEKTAFHLGNVFCVLAALFLGGFWGGMSGAVGLTISDLTSSYVTSAPKTFLMKLGIGLVTGFVAHQIFHISQERDDRRVPLSGAAILACVAGMAFNTVADPIVGYFYKMYVLGVPQEGAAIWVSMSAVTTAVNAVIAVIVSSILYLALRPALKRANLLPKI